MSNFDSEEHLGASCLDCMENSLRNRNSGTETSLELRQLSQIEAGSKGEKFLSKK